MITVRRLAVALKSAAALGLAGMASACGFSPIYADYDNQDLMHSLASIDVARIETVNDSGYVLQTELQRRLGNAGSAAEYFLEVDLDELLASEAITKQANTERYALILTAEYKLLDTLGETLFTDTVRTSVSYGVVDSPFATNVANDNALRTGAEQIANQIERDLLLYFKGGIVPEKDDLDALHDEFRRDEDQ